MINRKITSKIENWYSNSKTALLIDGARQIGKTTIIKNFIETNDLDCLELNLLENTTALEAFNTSTNCEQLLLRLSALSNTPLVPGKTVIFIDEIQAPNDAITPIKFLVQDGRFRYIFSGSLLGVKLQSISSIPVGFLEILQMYPLDFEEFVNAFAVSQDTLNYLERCYKERTTVDELVHQQMLSLFYVYLVVGGMPKAVQQFIDTNDLSMVNNVLRDIDTGYRLDISKYSRENILLIQDIYNLVPSELSKKTKRFFIKSININARFYKYESSFTWLKNSGVGLFVHNVDNPVYPLLASKERTLFKLFLCDVGLLSFKLYSGNQIALLNGEDTINKGAIYEAVVAQELKTHGYELYYNSDKKRGEIDFLIEREDNTLLPIEVKSGKDYKRHSALDNLLNNDAFNIDEGIVLCNSNVEVVNKKIYLPIYMVMFIKKKQENVSQRINIDISKLI